MVMKFLSDDEVITVAMNLEQEGRGFYDEAARLSKHKETKEIFNKLRDEEADHYKTFKDLLDNIQAAGPKGYFNINEEAVSYLNSLIETGVFKGIDKQSIKRLSEAEVLEIGLKVERDSVLYYNEAQKMSTNPKAREIMSKIIEIEKEHLVTLTNRLRVARRLF